jgi:hypothetical protein
MSSYLNVGRDIIRKIISLGGKPSNSKDNTNTLNTILINNIKPSFAIRRMLQIGAKPSNSQNSSNTLSTLFKTNSYEYTEVLIDSGAQPSIIEDDSNTLTIAVNQERLALSKDYVRDYYIKCINLIIEKGAQPSNADNNSNTLTAAVLQEGELSDKIMEIILKTGAQPSSAQDNSNTLTAAFKSGDNGKISLIMSMNAQPSNAEDDSNTLTAAVKLKYKQIILTLCDKYQNIKPSNAQNNSNTLTTIILSSYKSVLKDEYDDIMTPIIITQIINIGAQPSNAQDNSNTITIAVGRGYKDVVMILLQTFDVVYNRSNYGILKYVKEDMLLLLMASKILITDNSFLIWIKGLDLELIKYHDLFNKYLQLNEVGLSEFVDDQDLRKFAKELDNICDIVNGDKKDIMLDKKDNMLEKKDIKTLIDDALNLDTYEFPRELSQIISEYTKRMPSEKFWEKKFRGISNGGTVDSSMWINHCY